MRNVFMDPMLWGVTVILIFIIVAVNIPIYRECRAHGFGAYYCFMQGK